MIKRFLLVIALGSLLSACFPAPSESQGGPSPVPDEGLRLTAAVLSEQTLAALPTSSPIPTETLVILSAEPTATQPTPTETINPVLLTLTATLLAGTPTPGTPTTETAAGSETPITSSQPTAGTPLSGGAVGTQAPFLPYGTVQFANKSDADAYISLRCVTKEGYVTLLEYPVNKIFSVNAPAGSYTYIAWVGGRQFDGSFKMDKDGFITITFYKNRVNIKKD